MPIIHGQVLIIPFRVYALQNKKDSSQKEIYYYKFCKSKKSNKKESL
jgi:hypothetical protein